MQAIKKAAGEGNFEISDQNGNPSNENNSLGSGEQILGSNQIKNEESHQESHHQVPLPEGDSHVDTLMYIDPGFTEADVDEDKHERGNRQNQGTGPMPLPEEGSSEIMMTQMVQHEDRNIHEASRLHTAISVSHVALTMVPRPDSPVFGNAGLEVTQQMSMAMQDQTPPEIQQQPSEELQQPPQQPIVELEPAAIMSHQERVPTIEAENVDQPNEGPVLTTNTDEAIKTIETEGSEAPVQEAAAAAQSTGPPVSPRGGLKK